MDNAWGMLSPCTYVICIADGTLIVDTRIRILSSIFYSIFLTPCHLHHLQLHF